MPDARTQIAAAMQQLIATRTDLMIDECTVTRAASQPQTPQLDADGNVTAGDAAPPVYQGRCTFADPSAARLAGQTTTDEAGVPSAPVLRVPHAADLRPGDVVTCTASAVSPGLVGDVFVVIGEQERTYATYRRFALRGSSWESTATGG